MLAGIVLTALVSMSSVHADFGDDPLLRLQGFGRDAGPVPGRVPCGRAISNVVDAGGDGTLYSVARDDACHDVGQRRVAIGLAGGLVLAVAGFAGVITLDRRDERDPPVAPVGVKAPKPPREPKPPRKSKVEAADTSKRKNRRRKEKGAEVKTSPEPEPAASAGEQSDGVAGAGIGG